MWCCTVQKNILLSNSLCLAELAQITVNGRPGVTVYLVFPSFNEWHRHQPSWPSKKSRFYFSLPPYSVNHQCPLVHHLNNSWILPLFPVRTWYRHCLDLAHPHEPAFQCSSPGDFPAYGLFLPVRSLHSSSSLWKAQIWPFYSTPLYQIPQNPEEKW